MVHHAARSFVPQGNSRWGSTSSRPGRAAGRRGSEIGRLRRDPHARLHPPRREASPGSLAGRLSQRVKGLLMPWVRSGAVDYSVIDSGAELHPASGDQAQRSAPPHQAALDKVVDADNRFIVECQIRERSQGRAALTVKEAKIPDRVGLFDDSSCRSRRPRSSGARRSRSASASRPSMMRRPESDLAALSGKFYAVGK